MGTFIIFFRPLYSGKKDMKSLTDCDLCSIVKCAIKSSVTWLGSPRGKAAQTGQTYRNTKYFKNVEKKLVKLTMLAKKLSWSENIYFSFTIYFITLGLNSLFFIITVIIMVARNFGLLKQYMKGLGSFTTWNDKGKFDISSEDPLPGSW